MMKLADLVADLGARKYFQSPHKRRKKEKLGLIMLNKPSPKKVILLSIDFFFNGLPYVTVGRRGLQCLLKVTCHDCRQSG